MSETLVVRIPQLGGNVVTGKPVSACHCPSMGGGLRIATNAREDPCQSGGSDYRAAIVAQLIESWAGDEYLARLGRIEYLANICLVLELDRSLSGKYWLNVNNPGLPLVGVNEHSNFESAANYNGRLIVHLSNYLPYPDTPYTLDSQALFEYALRCVTAHVS